MFENEQEHHHNPTHYASNQSNNDSILKRLRRWNADL